MKGGIKELTGSVTASRAALTGPRRCIRVSLHRPCPDPKDHGAQWNRPGPASLSPRPSPGGPALMLHSFTQALSRLCRNALLSLSPEVG